MKNPFYFITCCLILVIALYFAQQVLCSTNESAPIASTNYSDIGLSITRAETINTPFTVYDSPEFNQIKLNGYLLLTLEIKNNGKKIVNYRSITFSGGPMPLSMDDESGNHYFRLQTEECEDAGMVIYPGESGTVTFAFQKPIPTAKQVTLSFPAFNILGEGIPVEAGDQRVIKLTFNPTDITVTRTKTEGDFGQSSGTALIDAKIGEPVKTNNLTIKITKVRIGAWDLYSPEQMEQFKDYDPVPKNEKVTQLAITYEIINSSENRKIDLAGFTFALSDEFKNNYQESPEAPYGFDGPKTNLNSNTQPTASLYPGSSTTNTVFFEEPVSSAKYLLWTISDYSGEEAKETTLRIPTSAITR